MGRRNFLLCFGSALIFGKEANSFPLH